MSKLQSSVAYSKTDILLETLLDFFREASHFETLSSIVNKNTTISLRILDWLVTNYAKKNNCTIEKFENGNLIAFKIYLDYKNQLRAYSKSNFDPFCRKNRLILNPYTMTIVDSMVNSRCFYTTIGQMNFFRWLIKNDIINYLLLNLEHIERDMLDIAIQNKQKSNKKRCCLSENNSKKINFFHSPIVVSF